MNISLREKRKQKSSCHSLDIVVLPFSYKELLKSVLLFGFLASEIDLRFFTVQHRICSPGFHVQVAYTVYYKAMMASSLLVLQNMN